jgi:RNA polymerase sigma factor (sigma-70 family)
LLEVVKKYDEPELVLLLKQRSQHSFSYLYDNYSGALHSIILNIVNEEELANDVLQEVFVKIWKQIETYDSSKGRLFTWMLNIARNASIDGPEPELPEQPAKPRVVRRRIYSRRH